MTDIVYTQDVIYELELTLHARVMLAFRYGIVLDNNFNEFIFKRTKSWGEKGGSVDIFHINNRKVVLVVNREEKVIKTALPEPGLWETTDAIAVGGMLDIACTTPPFMPIESIMSWRNDYIEGSISKDDVKKFIREYKREVHDKEQIGNESQAIIEHLTDQNVEKEIEIANLNNEIIKHKNVIQEIIRDVKKTSQLAIEGIEITQAYLNGEDGIQLRLNEFFKAYSPHSIKLKEYIETNWQQNDADNLDPNREIDVSQAIINFPWTNFVSGTFKRKTVYEIKNCKIEKILKPEDEFSEPIYQLLFSNEDKQYLATTYHKDFINYYESKVGNFTSVYKIKYGKKYFLHTPKHVD